MKPNAHAYAAGIQGGVVYLLTQSAAISIATCLSGIFIDIDHIFDYMFFPGDKFSYKRMFAWCEKGSWERVTLLFHSYELYLLLGITTFYFPNDILLGIMYGTGFHLLLDQIWNCSKRKGFRLHQGFYFLTYRASVGFHKDKLKVIADRDHS